MKIVVLAFLLSLCLSNSTNTDTIQKDKMALVSTINVVTFSETNVNDIVFNWRRIFPSYRFRTPRMLA